MPHSTRESYLDRLSSKLPSDTMNPRISMEKFPDHVDSLNGNSYINKVPLLRAMIHSWYRSSGSMAAPGGTVERGWMGKCEHTRGGGVMLFGRYGRGGQASAPMLMKISEIFS